MSRTPAPESTEALARHVAAAGVDGISSTQLLEQLPGWSRSKLYAALKRAIEQGLVIMERQHPIAWYYGAGVPRAERIANFAQRLQQERERRGHKVRAGHLEHANRKRAAAGKALLTLRKPVRAVDPRALRADATVTRPANVQTVICPPYRTPLERMAAAAAAAPLPADPPSPWVQAVIQPRASGKEAA